MVGNLTFGNGFFHEYIGNFNQRNMKIAWTTTETLAQAKNLAKQCIDSKLAVCAQISSPITSIYQWNGEMEETIEFRITLKFLKSRQSELKKLVLEIHPYETPQWAVADLSEVSEGYRTWAEG